jgi:hypothetical protein
MAIFKFQILSIINEGSDLLDKVTAFSGLLKYINLVCDLIMVGWDGFL